MKTFEDATKPKQNAALILAELFNKAEVIPPHPVNKTMSPSSLACPVGCAFKLQGRETGEGKESFQSRGFAEAGEDRHKRIQEFLSKSGYWVNVGDYVKEKGLPLEVVMQDGFETLLYSDRYQVRFRCDGLLKIDGVYYILEIKTERQNANTYRTGPDQKHQPQGICYSLLLEVKNILWVYEGRDYLEQKVYLQEVTTQQVDEMSLYLDNILENVNTPEKLERNKKCCTYCEYNKYCKMYFKELEKKLYLEAQNEAGLLKAKK